MHPVIREAEKMNLEGSVIDLDKTGYHGNFAQSIGYGFWKREAKSLHAGNMLKGLYGILKIKSMPLDWNGKEERNSRGLEILFKTLRETGCADRNHAYYRAGEHAIKNEMDGFGNFLRDLKRLGPVIISTGECDIAADVVSGFHDMDGWVAKPVIYRYKTTTASSSPIVFRKNGIWKGKNYIEGNPIIEGIVTRTLEDKKANTEKLLEEYELNLSNVLAIGDSKDDISVLERAGLSASSPSAEKEVIKRTDNHIRCYLD